MLRAPSAIKRWPFTIPARNADSTATKPWPPPNKALKLAAADEYGRIAFCSSGVPRDSALPPCACGHFGRSLAPKPLDGAEEKVCP